MPKLPETVSSEIAARLRAGQSISRINQELHIAIGPIRDILRWLHSKGESTPIYPVGDVDPGAPDRSRYRNQYRNRIYKLTPEQVLQIKQRLRAKERNMTELADEYDVSPATISSIYHGRTWSTVTDKMVFDGDGQAVITEDLPAGEDLELTPAIPEETTEGRPGSGIPRYNAKPDGNFT